MKCEKCGVDLKVGDWPFCSGDPTKHVSAIGYGEDPISPYWDDELGAEITTRAERRRIMSKLDLEYHDVSRKRRGKVYVHMGS